MERNKLETQIREKLNSREIQPSSQTWDRLDAMLSVAEEKKTKRSFFLSFQFIGIAASILVLLTVGMFLFTQKNTTIELQNNVVGIEIKKDTIKNAVKKISSHVINQKQKTEAVVSVENKLRTKNLQPKNKSSIINQKTTVNQNQIIKDKEIEFLYPTDIAIKDIPKIQNTKGIIIVNSSNFKSDEALIAELENTAKKLTTKKSVVKIDAKSLLSQVDGELEQTFREKVITKISKNYKSAKVALVNRNNE